MNRQSSYFEPGQVVLYGKYKNHKGKILSFGQDKWGNPTVTIEPIPKGRKQPKTLGLFRIWRADVKEKALAERDLAVKVATRYIVAAVARGETVEQGDVRIHRYADVFFIWDLTNAGKRGKKVKMMAVQPNHYYYKGDRAKWFDSMSRAIEHYRTYKDVKNFFEDVLVDYPNEIDIDEREERGVDVYPGGFMPVKVNGKGVYVEVGYKDFTVRNLDDKYNETTCIPAIKGSKKAIPVFYRWVKDNESKIKSMTFREVLTEMDKLDVPYHQYCAMD